MRSGHIPSGPRPHVHLLEPGGGFQGNRCCQLDRQELGGVWPEFQLRDWASPGTELGCSGLLWAL